MDEELTPWFPPEVKPVHPGVYERDASQLDLSAASIKYYSHWDGVWFILKRSPEQAGNESGGPYHSFRQHLPWRGLAKDPNANL